MINKYSVFYKLTDVAIKMFNNSNISALEKDEIILKDEIFKALQDYEFKLSDDVQEAYDTLFSSDSNFIMTGKKMLNIINTIENYYYNVYLKNRKLLVIQKEKEILQKEFEM